MALSSEELARKVAQVVLLGSADADVEVLQRGLLTQEQILLVADVQQANEHDVAAQGDDVGVLKPFHSLRDGPLEHAAGLPVRAGGRRGAAQQPLVVDSLLVIRWRQYHATERLLYLEDVHVSRDGGGNNHACRCVRSPLQGRGALRGLAQRDHRLKSVCRVHSLDGNVQRFIRRARSMQRIAVQLVQSEIGDSALDDVLVGAPRVVVIDEVDLVVLSPGEVLADARRAEWRLLVLGVKDLQKRQGLIIGGVCPPILVAGHAQSSISQGA
ncbi:acylamino-acid-releasing enzyme [Babesia caballi]|uniref:Acylamino-acid-releasing enzyme n=1 Tax=Babesia caballi TaxID=5871 RepID=A0AAV4LW21_BABCB|nr:acylamino-acid-releasing enzyme [Babesia caballi]